jgi:hypothetical protein
VREQPNQYRVTFYCDRCARRDGRNRIVAVADRGVDPQHPDFWWMSVARRAGRAPTKPSSAVGTSRSGGLPHGESKRVKMQVGRRLVLVPLHPLDSAAQLICRHCKARPRIAQAKLIQLADQAMAIGRHDAYA